MESGEKSAQILALNLIKKWLRSNYIGYIQTNGTMFEKYDAEKVRVKINKLIVYKLKIIKIIEIDSIVFIIIS